MLDDVRVLERAARLPEAMTRLASAIAVAESQDDASSLAEGLRRLGVLRHQRGDAADARRLCERSYDVARRARLDVLAAKALNALGVQYMLAGAPGDARREFERALGTGADSPELRARVEQNLGILANIQGELEIALAHYRRSLEAYRQLGDEHGCALAYHNLGMVSSDRADHPVAEECYRASLAIAERIGDASLQGLCLVSLADLDVSCQRYENARQGAESALAIFGRLGAHRGKADAYRVIGMMYRETGRPALAESRLTSAIQLAVVADAALIEAEACRELALLHRTNGRNREALQLLNRAHRLFHRLDARADAVHVGGRMAELQGTYLTVVREWGESIESSDSHTFGHCERVARYAVAMSRALALDDHEETTVLLGAYLHDVGMVRVPHEILTRTAAPTPDERAILEQHPAWGIELLADVEFPWDIKPIVRWHHERRDGSGYPDRLCGDEIPLGAQIVGILDAYDDLRVGRFGRPPLDAKDAAWRIVEQRGLWSERVFTAFMRAVS